VRWLPFQLNPDLPASGMPRREYIERKWGPGRGPQVYSRVAAAGETVNIPFAFDHITVQPNTLNAHRLLTFAEREGRQTLHAPGARIHPTARVDASILWDDVEVGAGSSLRECIVTDGVRVPADTSWIGVTLRPAGAELADGEHRIGELAVCSL